jgi:5,10-methylenetetrahydromethanopterin reductase
VSYGLQLIVICHPDIEAIRPLATSMVTPLARFQVIQREAAGPLSESDAANFAAIRRGYDMTKHGDIQAEKRLVGETLTWDFVKRFAIVGPPEHCIERLLELAALGIERFVVVGPGFHPEARNDGRTLFATEVMPAVRAALSQR